MDTVAPAFGAGGIATGGKPGRPGAPMDGGKVPGNVGGNGPVAGTGTSIGAPGSEGPIPGGIGMVKAFGGSVPTGCMSALCLHRPGGRLPAPYTLHHRAAVT
eukprot:CAMPEP_0114639554 /NCGR_PEP_ID=MMETSP0191-20121206/1233_1 /TAXON_ID=126664 /ORGANISM="Sorites sp." /LENGTH=101 /DNA_ID=CAMNT_0001851431 /DNA_START=982 /DNA_END=1287 /DNA_ORIENTATION=+